MSEINVHDEITNIFKTNNIELSQGVEVMLELICGNLIKATFDQSKSIQETRRRLSGLLLAIFDHMLNQHLGEEHEQT